MKNLLVWIKKKKLSDWLLASVLLVVLVMRGPTFYVQFRQQNTTLPQVKLSGKVFPPPGSKSILIFWASWCGPCTIELKRIEKALRTNEISANNIYAVNVGESKSIVDRVIKERQLKIPVVSDDSGELATLLKVNATPTVVFVDEKGKINWITSGLSPTLIFRIKSFQNN